MGDVGLVEPLDPEVAVEVGGGLAEPQLGVVLQGVLHVHREQAPDRGRGELKNRGKNQISCVVNRLFFKKKKYAFFAETSET